MSIYRESEVFMRMKAIFVHRDSGEFMENRFDTLMMVNGSIASLLTITQQLGVEAVAIDESYPGTAFLLDFIHKEVDACLSQDITPVVFCTILSYNAHKSLQFLMDLKRQYGKRIRTGVGGQLTRIAPEAYLNYWFIDHVGVGDAECTLRQLLLGGQRIAKGSLFGELQTLSLVKDWKHYAPLSYDGYVGFPERLDEMSKHHLGPFTGIRQAVMESVRGCSWAYETGKACDFCALQDITTKPTINLFQQFAQEREFAERWGCNWVFDVSNQWLPRLSRKAELLQEYLEARRKAEVPLLNKYVYLTSNSIDAQTAPLFKEAGIRIAYVGIDGWNEETWESHHKAGRKQVIQQCLDACKANQIYLRTAAVIGGGATRENLPELQQFIRHLTENYGDILISYGCFLEIILPGAPVWFKFKNQAEREGIQDALRLYDKMYTKGYLDRMDERDLTRLFMQHSPTCSISFDEAEEVERWAREYIDSHCSGTATSIEHGGKSIA